MVVAGLEDEKDDPEPRNAWVLQGYTSLNNVKKVKMEDNGHSFWKNNPEQRHRDSKHEAYIKLVSKWYKLGIFQEHIIYPDKNVSSKRK